MVLCGAVRCWLGMVRFRAGKVMCSSVLVRFRDVLCGAGEVRSREVPVLFGEVPCRWGFGVVKYRYGNVESGGGVVSSS